MGVLCMLLDKKKQYSSLLADIFNITGHKLLIALDEEKALELLKASEPEVLILPVEDINFWFKLLELGRYLTPVVFVESYEDVESLRKYGLRDVNCVVLPFNPMELLTKIVALSRESQDAASLSTLGPLNITLKLLRKGASSSITIQDEGNTCTIYIHQGLIKGSSCSKEDILTLISKDTKTILDIYEEDKAKMNNIYKDNWDFLSTLLYGIVSQQPVVEVTSEKEAPAVIRPTFDTSQPVELGDGFFWVGVPQENSLFQKNAYLRIYEKENVRVPVLINIGAMQDYPLIRAKLEQIIGTVDAIRAVVVLGSGVEECSGILNFLQSNQRAFVITSLSLSQKLRSIGIPQARIRVFETFPNRSLRLATGHVLKFIPLAFLPEVGSFAMLEEGKGYLFTGRFLSSLCTAKDLNPLEGGDLDDTFIYTSLIIPSQDILNRTLGQIKEEEISSILPLYGNPVKSKENIRELFIRLERSILPSAFPIQDRETVLEICNGVLGYLRESLEGSEFQNLLEDLSNFAYVEGDKILDFFVQAESMPSLILGLMYAKGMNPEAMKHALKYFYRSGILLTI